MTKSSRSPRNQPRGVGQQHLDLFQVAVVDEEHGEGVAGRARAFVVERASQPQVADDKAAQMFGVRVGRREEAARSSDITPMQPDERGNSLYMATLIWRQHIAGLSGLDEGVVPPPVSTNRLANQTWACPSRARLPARSASRWVRRRAVSASSTRSRLTRFTARLSCARSSRSERRGCPSTAARARLVSSSAP